MALRSPTPRAECLSASLSVGEERQAASAARTAGTRFEIRAGLIFFFFFYPPPPLLESGAPNCLAGVRESSSFTQRSGRAERGAHISPNPEQRTESEPRASGSRSEEAEEAEEARVLRLPNSQTG